MQIKISIIVPVFNSQKYLRDCLTSMCTQTNNEVEIIIINDGSTDSSIKICEKYKKNFKYIRLVNLNKNKGVGYCRKIGCKIAKGKYICFVDSDDKLSLNSIKNFLNQISKYPNTDLFVLRNTTIGINRVHNFKIDKNQIFINKKKEINSKHLITRIKNFNDFRPTCWNYLISNNFLKKNNINFNDSIISEDWPFVVKIIVLAKSYKIIERPSYIYRRTEVNTLTSLTGYRAIVAYIKTFIEIGFFLNNNKKNINKLKIKFLCTFLQNAINCISVDLIICQKHQIKKISNYFVKNYFLISKLFKNKFIKKTFLINDKKKIFKNLTKYKYQRLKVIEKEFKKLNNRNIVLFCAGRIARVAINIFDSFDANIINIFDNNPRLSNQKVSNIKITHPLILKKKIKKILEY